MARQVSLHGNRLYVDKDDYVVARRAQATGGGGDKPMIVLPGAPDVVAIWEDFIGDAATPTGPNLEDTGSGGVTRVVGTNGVVRITVGDTGGASQPADPHVIVGAQLDWKANQGPGDQSGDLRMVARVKKNVIADGKHGLFIGFTDNDAAEMPVHDTGAATMTATATNAVGIMANVEGDTGWVAVGVDGGTLQSEVLDTGFAAGLYDTLEVQVRRGGGDTGGSAVFKVNGKVSAVIDNPVNVSTAMTPIVAAYDTGGAAVVDVDYINVSAPRDTGM